MPNLIHLHNFRGDPPRMHPPYYFKNAERKYSTQSWRFNPVEDYPYIVYIHYDNLDPYDNMTLDNNGFWLDLRRWVERQAAGDLLVDYENKNYRWWWNKDAKAEYQKKYSEVKHGYWHFYFECESDLQMFILMHGRMVTGKAEKYHPDYGKDIDEQRRMRANEKTT
jgi:hypothetical protein